MRRVLRLGFWIGLVAIAAWLVQRSRRHELDVVAPAPRPTPAPPPKPVAAWVVPDPGGTCPSSHPIKAKLRSKLFHLPGMVAYERTNPDRCYRDEAAAEADGLTRAKR